MGLTALWLAVWAVSVLLAAFVGYGTAWAIGFARGRAWESSRAQSRWDGRDRRGVVPPPAVPPTVGVGIPAQSAPKRARAEEAPDGDGPAVDRRGLAGGGDDHRDADRPGDQAGGVP